jgi:hypothetical protein
MPGKRCAKKFYWTSPDYSSLPFPKFETRFVGFMPSNDGKKLYVTYEIVEVPSNKSKE